jgi:hypothetical protein
MTKYGERIFKDASSKEDDRGDAFGPERVMFGGCGVRFGSFRRPARPARKKPASGLWAWPGLGKRKPEEDSG